MSFQRTLQAVIRATHAAHDLRLEAARVGGAKDGSSNIPDDSATVISPQEKAIQAMFAADMARLQTELGGEFDSERAHHAATQDRLAAAQTKSQTAERQWNEQEARMLRSFLHSLIPWRYYLLIMGLIVAGEIPLNTIVFAIFGENWLLTMILGLTIATSIPLSAHFTGVWLRQAKDLDPKHRKARLLAAITLFGLIAVAILRYRYFLTVLREDTAPESLAFLVINVLVFAVAVAASWFAHDDDLKFEKAYFYKKECQRECDALGATRAEIAKRCDSMLVQLRGRERVIDQLYEEAIYRYRGANLSARTGTSAPGAEAQADPGGQRARKDQPVCWLKENKLYVEPLRNHFFRRIAFLNATDKEEAGDS